MRKNLMFKERCGNADLFFEANKKRLPTLAKIIHYPAGIINASSFFRFSKFRPAGNDGVLDCFHGVPVVLFSA